MKELEELFKVPRGYYISKESTVDNIVLKKIEASDIKTWEDLSNYTFTKPLYYINDISKIECFSTQDLEEDIFDDSHSNMLPSEEYAKAMLALMKLLMVRSFYIKDWKPNWKEATLKYSIYFDIDDITYDPFTMMARVLSFPTEDMVKEFISNNRELILEAKLVL